MPSNICKKSGLASFSFSQNKIEKTAFFKGSRGISSLNLNKSEVGIIQIKNSVWINPSSNLFGLKTWFGFIQFTASDWNGMIRINLWLIFNKREAKRFPDWFRKIFRNTSDSFGLNSFLKIPPGLSPKIFLYTFWLSRIKNLV